MEIDERKKRILQAIIDDYVLTAEPVGSRTISRKYELGVSPATIRNEMSDLEEMGYIEQPHTSAGRIPSHKGYRFYVDNLMKKESIGVEHDGEFREIYGWEDLEIEEIVKRTAKILSDLTNYPTIITMGEDKKNKIKCIQILPFEDTQGLVVIVDDAGKVDSSLIEIPSEISRGELNVVSNLLSEKLKGLYWNDRQTIIQEIENEVFRYKVIWEQVKRILDKRFQKAGSLKIYLEGISHILSQPEFQDIEKLKVIMGILEEEVKLKEVILGLQNGLDAGITIKIGNEICREEMADCSVVTATYCVNGKEIGTLGVLGPTRMNYKRAFSAVEFFSNHLMKILEKVFCQKH